MTENVPVDERIEQVVIITVDCLRWDYHNLYRKLYPNGVWYRATPQATYTPTSHTSLFTGLNPHRHGVYSFGDSCRNRKTLLSATNSVSTSALTRTEDGLVYGLDTNENITGFSFARWFPNKLENTDSTSEYVVGLENDEEMVSRFRDYDLVFLHDWILHGTGPGDDEEEWHYTAGQKGEPEYNHRQYRNQLEMSLTAHENLLQMFRKVGLYENTLFVIWGDHGQALGSAPFNALAHGHFPEESVARVPIAFASPLFDSDRVDTATNARAVDVVPTLETILEIADVPMDEMTHEYEGVDLTRFEGTLAGYTMGSKTSSNGYWDGIRTDDFAYVVLDDDESMLLETAVESDKDNGYRLQREVDNPAMKAKLNRMYEEVRTEPTSLVYRREPDKEWLEAMGYL